MRKLKIYLDTSAISLLHYNKNDERVADSQKMWELIKNGEYDVYLSPTLFEEIENNIEPKLSILLDYIDNINYKVLEMTEDVIKLANDYIDNNVLPKGSFNDAIHVAFAVIYNCDFIVSWNFKHLANVKTMNKVKIVNTMNGYKDISIVPPTMLIEKES